MNPQNKHVLVIGNIRNSHEYLVSAGYDITWVYKRTDGFVHTMEDNNRCLNIFSYSDPDQEYLIDLSKFINKCKKIDAVIAFHDASQLDAIAISKVLNLPYDLSAETVTITRDKKLTRERLKQFSLTNVTSKIINNDDEIKTFFNSTKNINKIIIKPIDGTGSENVFSLTKKDFQSNKNNEMLNSIQYPILVEEFIEGREFSVEAFSLKGQHYIIAITEKFKAKDSYMELGHLIPARLSKHETSLIHKYVKSCLTALTINSGASHTEVILNGEKLDLIETHTRTGGDRIADLVKYVTNVNLYKLQAMDYLHTKIDEDKIIPQDSGKHAYIEYMIQDESQSPIKEVKGIDEVKQWQWVKEAECIYGKGDKLPKVNHSFDRAAYVMAVSDCADDSINTAHAAINKIEFVCND